MLRDMGSATGRTITRPVEVWPAALALAAAAGAWLVTAGRMAGMDAGPGTDLGAAGWFFGVWVTMMAAMMLPSLVPMVTAHARGRTANPTGTSVLFVTGYLVAWGAAGLLGFAVDQAARSLDLHFLAWETGGRYVAAGVILGAAVYQVTRPKETCLRRCRDASALRRHHPGPLGALRTGIEHGAFCVGCCWALMAALFALGVMSLAWMAVIAAMIAAEKLLPWKAIASRGVAIVLVVLAVAVALVPDAMPGLTVPGGPMNDSAMESMR